MMFPPRAGGANDAHDPFEPTDRRTADRELLARGQGGDPGRGLGLHLGQIAHDADGNLVGSGDLPAQTEQVFRNLAGVLEANGASFDDVVKIQTFLTTMDGLQGSRDVRARYLPDEPPASTAVQVAALMVPEALIEVDVVAALPAHG